MRLGEIQEQSAGSDPIEELREFSIAAEELDGELAASEKNDHALRTYAQEAFARRGSLARYLMAHGRLDDVVKVGREFLLRSNCARKKAG